MPTYEYGCTACGHRMDIFATLSDYEKGLKIVCPKCSSKKVEQQFSCLAVKLQKEPSYPEKIISIPKKCNCT